MALHPHTSYIGQHAELVLFCISSHVSVSNLSTLRAYLRSEDLVDVFAQWHCGHHYMHAKHRVGFACVANALVAVRDLFHLGVGRSPFISVCLDDRVHEKCNKGRVGILGRCL